MTLDALTGHTPRPAILRWVFRSGDMILTCRLDRQTSGGYAVVIIPKGNAPASAGRVAVYPSAIEAVRQHAAVATALRDLGWTLVERTTASHLSGSISQRAAA